METVKEKREMKKIFANRGKKGAEREMVVISEKVCTFVGTRSSEEYNSTRSN
jgi:hypothetical protein